MKASPDRRARHSHTEKVRCMCADASSRAPLLKTLQQRLSTLVQPHLSSSETSRCLGTATVCSRCTYTTGRLHNALQPRPVYSKPLELWPGSSDTLPDRQSQVQECRVQSFARKVDCKRPSNAWQQSIFSRSARRNSAACQRVGHKSEPKNLILAQTLSPLPCMPQLEGRSTGHFDTLLCSPEGLKAGSRSH